MTEDDGETEVLVIGGGPGGYVAAIRAGQLGLDVTLVERDGPGGTCINRGCIPSKALLSATDLAYRAATAESMGIRADPTVDLGTTVDWKDGIVEQLTGGIEQLCAGADVRLVDGVAEFVEPGRARIVSDDGEGVVRFEHAIVATGSRPIELPAFAYDDDPVMDSGGALDRRDAPDRLVVVGAGYIGMELSTVFARLGTDVAVVEALDSVLPGWEPRLTRPVRTAAKRIGVEFNFGEFAASWRGAADGGIVVETEAEDGERSEYPADAVLVAVGREPVTETVNLGAVGLEPDEDGFIPTDERCRTETDRIFAVGDVAGEQMLAHKASAEGEVAAETIAGEPASMADRAVPAVVYTDPEIATVGLSPDGAEDAGYDPIVGRFQLRANGRAMTVDATDGFVRVVADGETGRLLGGQVVGPEAAELIAELGLAVEAGLAVETLADTIHAHPTLAESTMEAAKQALGRAIHAVNR